MEIPTLVLREAITAKLAPLQFTYGSPPVTVYIATFEEYLQETSTRKKAILNIGTMQVEAYIILLNQTMNENGSKCMRNDMTSIQIQCVTVFPANKGGSKTSELIAKAVLGLLLDSDGNFSILDLSEPCNAWKGELVTMQPINFDDNNSRTWITQLVLEYGITQ